MFRDFTFTCHYSLVKVSLSAFDLFPATLEPCFLFMFNLYYCHTLTTRQAFDDVPDEGKYRALCSSYFYAIVEIERIIGQHHLAFDMLSCKESFWLKVNSITDIVIENLERKPRMSTLWIPSNHFVEKRGLFPSRELKKEHKRYGSFRDTSALALHSQ